MKLLLSNVTKEQATKYLEELKGLTQKQAKERFENVNDKEWWKTAENENYFVFTNLVYLYVSDGGNIEKDFDTLISDLNFYIVNQSPENDVLDKLIIKKRKVCLAKIKISNRDFYSLSA